MAKSWSVWELIGRVAALTQERDEYREEAQRCRKLAKSVIDGVDTSGVLVEVSRGDKRGEAHLIICAPGLDEHNLGQAGREIIAALVTEGRTGELPPGWSMTPPRVIGTKARRPRHDIAPSLRRRITTTDGE